MDIYDFLNFKWNTGTTAFCTQMFIQVVQRSDTLMEDIWLKPTEIVREEIWKDYGEPQLLKRTIYFCALCFFFF